MLSGNSQLVRKNPYLFRDTILKLIASPNLEYKQLTDQIGRGVTAPELLETAGKNGCSPASNPNAGNEGQAPVCAPHSTNCFESPKCVQNQAVFRYPSGSGSAMGSGVNELCSLVLRFDSLLPLQRSY